MKITLKRKFKGDKYTIGDVYIDGVYFCNTIEDVVRTLPATCPNTPKWLNCKCREKVYAETAIPAGTYKVSLQHSPKFKRILPFLHDVPHFLGILIHAGNNQLDTAGCIIVGHNTAKGKVTQSKDTLEKLIALIREAKEVTIDIE